MHYFANPSTPNVRAAMTAGRLGCIVTPKQGQAVPPGAWWCADNGCFGKGYPGDQAWITWLRALPWPRDKAVFATAPDVVGDAQATLQRSAPWLPLIREAGYPAALVAQDGLENLTIPWDTFDVLFIGGTTDWKLSKAAAAIIKDAKAHHKWVHMGRVNTRLRLLVARNTDCDSVDGTFISFGPDKNLPRMLTWLEEVRLI